MSRELETVTLWRDGGGGLWLGRSGPERPWNWLTGTVAYRDASGFARRWTPGMMKPTHGKGRCKPRPWAASSP